MCGRCTCLAAVSLLLSVAGLSLAGQLSDFEKSVDADPARERTDTRARPPHSHGRHGTSTSFGDIAGTALVGCLCEGFSHGIVYGGIASVERVFGGDSQCEGRKPGEALIPFFALDLNYQDVDGDVTAWDFRSEIGVGPIAFEARRTEYREDADDLAITGMHGLYRMSAGSLLEVDIGCGALRVSGQDVETGFSVTLPIRLHPSDVFGIEYRPVWSSVNETRISSHDLSVLCGWRHAGLRVGYRWLSTAGETLNGPEIGLSLRW